MLPKIADCTLRSCSQNSFLDAISNAIGYAEHRSRSDRAVICVYDESGNVIKTHEHAGDFTEP